MHQLFHDLRHSLATKLIFALGITPIRRLIRGTRRIAKGDHTNRLRLTPRDELYQERKESQTLFEQVPCLITVQGKDYRLIKYNRLFAENFDPTPGDFCFHAYKGRDEKCVACPVEKTFADGRIHISEETGKNKDGKAFHWLVTTSPLRNEQGEIVAAMEMSLDITDRKVLEKELAKSEKKYYAIFNNIPNPVFVLDVETLKVLDCNESVGIVYGYAKEEIIDRSFLDLFKEEERKNCFEKIKSRDRSAINQVRQICKDGRIIFVNIRISPSEYPGQKVLLVTTSDITKRLEAEQQLIQASKMATLGEMATGVAHELNQPLSVIKTASSFFIKKVNRDEPIKAETMSTLAKEIDSHVDRATNIINHMRQFGRKSDMTLTRIDLNSVIKSAFDIFSQQLKIRGIEVVWEIEEDLPPILGEAGRLEQVFINLLINARDAIEERAEADIFKAGEKRITLRTGVQEKKREKWVKSEVCDTGVGIPEAVVDRIFEPFFTTKKVGKGTGLGLSITYGIIKDCGGTVRAVSEPEAGTCFVIHFPIPEGEA